MLKSPKIPYRYHMIKTDDGVTLEAQTTGEGPAVLLANGIGVIKPGLNPLVGELRKKYRVICWDYRGCGNSRIKQYPADFSMARHASDALQVLHGVGAKRAAVFGWSMGVPVGLEMIRQEPDAVAGLGALFGSPKYPFRSGFFKFPVSNLIELNFKFAKRFHLHTQALLTLGSVVPVVAWKICTGIGFVGKSANKDLFTSEVRMCWADDSKAYFQTMSELLDHDARDVLPGITCPVLVVAGTKDWVTHPRAAKEMANLAQNSRLVIIKGASHFGVIEHGPELWDPIDEFLGEVWNES